MTYEDDFEAEMRWEAAEAAAIEEVEAWFRSPEGRAAEAAEMAAQQAYAEEQYQEELQQAFAEMLEDGEVDAVFAEWEMFQEEYEAEQEARWEALHDI